MALKKSQLLIDLWISIRIARPEQSRQEMRQEKERTEKHKESFLTKPQLNLTTKEMAVFFIAQQNKLS
jgi:hypothetical protein